MKSDRIITNETIEVQVDDVFHFINSGYKPFWHAGPKLEINKKEKTINLSGYNSGFYLLHETLDKIIDEGKIIPNQDYLIELNIKITKLEKPK